MQGKSQISVCLLLLISALVLSSCNKTHQQDDLVTEPPNPIRYGEDFALVDQKSKFHQLSYYSDYKGIVLISHGLECPIVRQSLAEIEEIKNEYEELGYKFMFINALTQDDLPELIKAADSYGLDIPILRDDSQVISDAYHIKRTGEALLIDTKTWEVKYRGPINDRLGYGSKRAEAKQHYLELALREHSQNKAITYPSIEYKGCLISYEYDEQQKQDISYSKDVAPILENKCMGCHKEGGIAPWAMTDYKTVKAWSPMMREVIRTKRMPPWHADKESPHIIDKVSLSPEEERRLIYWIEEGAQKDENEADPLLDYHPHKDTDWAFGKPDKIFEAGELDVPATGALDYRYVEVKLHNTEDWWISKVHLKPGNPKVVHHSFVFVVPPKEFQEKAEHPIGKGWSSGVFATFVPGVHGEISPPEALRYIPKGSSIIFEIHYTPIGVKEKDNTEVGFYFAKRKTKEQYRSQAIYNRWLRIPAHEENWPAEASYDVKQDIRVYEFMPHMHYRGKTMTYFLEKPSGERDLLLSIPRFDFNWQRQYKLDTPLVIHKGSRIVVEGAFDNSKKNPFNPDPDKTVGFGAQTTDEMFIGYMSYSYVEKGDE